MEQDRRIVIRGMVCDRCISIVRDALSSLALRIRSISLGEVTMISSVGATPITVIEERLNRLGFTLVEDKKEKLVRETKELVQLVYSGTFDFPPDFRLSDLIQRHFYKDYNLISATFSTFEGITLEKYIIAYRIEKVKELLLYSEHSLADISFNLGFSSVSHLSRQFKSLTGLTITHFRDVKKNKELVAGSRN